MADGLSPPAPAAAFDDAATSYDAQFTATAAGAQLRESVWSQLAPFIAPGMRVLDLGCGTGEDALFLARNGCRVTAADGSPAMLDQVAAKAARFNLVQRIRTLSLDLNARECDPPPGHPFDLVLSNFGAINCVEDLGLLGRKLESWTKPRAIVALIFMGRFCAWESAYYLARFDSRAFRRWRGRARARVGSSTLTVRYWSMRELRREFSAAFSVLGTFGVGTFLPPSYLFPWLENRPTVLRALVRCEQAASRVFPFSRVGDHTLLILRRRDAAVSARSAP